MSMRNFDMNRLDGLLAIYCLGGSFTAFISAMVIGIVAKSENIFDQVVLYDTAFYIVLAGGLLLIAGAVLSYLNSNAAQAAGVVTDSKARTIIIGLFVLTLISTILYALVPNLV